MPVLKVLDEPLADTPEDPELAQLQENYARNSQFAKPGGYTTPLSHDQEMQFREWVDKNNVPYDTTWPPDQRMQDYDMRGFWKAQQAGDAAAKRAAENGHFPDTWKTPYHESFSNESKYAKPDAPKWKGDKLIGPGGVVIFDASKHP